MIKAKINKTKDKLLPTLQLFCFLSKSRLTINNKVGSCPIFFFPITYIVKTRLMAFFKVVLSSLYLCLLIRPSY